MFFLSNKKEEEVINFKDEEVLKDSINNPKLFSLLVSKYEKVFLRRSMKILKNKEDAEDVVQEVFIKIYKNAEKFKEQEGAYFKSWAFRILTNTCFSKYRDREVTASLDIENAFEPVSPAEKFNSDSWLLKDSLNRLLNLLPSSLSKLLRLHYLEEKPQKEIANILGITPEAVRVRIHRAKKELIKVSQNNF